MLLANSEGIDHRCLNNRLGIKLKRLGRCETACRLRGDGAPPERFRRRSKEHRLAAVVKENDVDLRPPVVVVAYRNTKKDGCWFGETRRTDKERIPV